jgi:hypothetical protein
LSDVVHFSNVNKKEREKNLMKNGTHGLKTQNVKTVLVKFFFTNPNHVPQGIPEKERDDNAHVDGRRMAANMKNGELDPKYQLGRVRKGRVDSGTPVFGRHGVHNVRAHMLKGDLIRTGFVLTDLHWFVQPAREAGKMAKCVVVAMYQKDGAATNLPRGVATTMQELSNVTWECAHVWDNTNTGKPATVNFVGRKPDADFKNAIIIKNGVMQNRRKGENMYRHDKRGQYKKRPTTTA